ncbi:MAG TPA: vWA domain-containing protein [Ktedonobacteraceae bacterium]|jgi:Mg-chelatase subunit ChlD
MRRKAIWLSLLLASSALFMGGLLPPGKSAQARTPEPMHTAATGHVTILILDMSSSMVGNDSAQVRCQAAEAFIDLNGPGNMVGVIGMAGEQAQVWQTPLPTDVTSERATLKRAIEQRPPGSPDCQNPSGNTPTASALNLAWDMLNTTTARENLLGSAILLSDGVPTPDDRNTQSKTIQYNLLPRFQQRHWPIDTIALGTRQVLRTFLQKITQLTGGIAYDDTRGAVPGEVSSLNILPFFLDILNQRLGHTLASEVPLTVLSSGTRAYNITLDTTAKELAILLVRDARADGSISAQLISPGPAPLVLPSQTAIPDTDVEENPSYMAFSIQGPQSGEWELDVHGDGRFEVDVLETSWLQVAFLTPQQNGTLLNSNNPFPLLATIVDARNPDNPLSYPGARLTAILTYQNKQQTTLPSRQYAMTEKPAPDNGSSQEYLATIRLPAKAPDGTYILTITVTDKTGAILAENTVTVRLVHFPVPVLHAQQIIEYQWPPWALAMLQQPVLSQIYTWTSEDGSTTIAGTIKVNGSPYPAARVVQATLIGPTGTRQALNVIGGEQGTFQVNLPIEPDGDYTLAFALSGSFEGTTGALGNTRLAIHLRAMPATGTMIFAFVALSVLLATLLLCLMILLFLFLTGPRPFGGCICEEPGGCYLFSQVHRRPGVWRNHLRSETISEMSGKGHLPSGLRFRFSRALPFIRPRRILARRQGREGIFWQARLGSIERPLSRWRYREVSHLSHQVIIDKRVRPLPLKNYRVIADSQQLTQKTTSRK